MVHPQTSLRLFLPKVEVKFLLYVRLCESGFAIIFLVARHYMVVFLIYREWRAGTDPNWQECYPPYALYLLSWSKALFLTQWQKYPIYDWAKLMVIHLFHLNEMLVLKPGRQNAGNKKKPGDCCFTFFTVSSSCKVKSALKSNIVLSSDICKRL